MKDRNRQTAWDDGKTIADMSRLTGKGNRANPDLPKPEITPQERRGTVLGALKATLLIALIYLGGLALVIFCLLALWK